MPESPGVQSEGTCKMLARHGACFDEHAGNLRGATIVMSVMAWGRRIR